MTSANFIRNHRKLELIKYPRYYQMYSGTSLEKDDDYGRFSDSLSIFKTTTAREECGYNLASKEFYECLDGMRENPGTCFAENLALLKRRNNPRDRLICATLRNPDEEICHCFIVNGKNIIDHSNYRRKNYCFEKYRRCNMLVRYIECDRARDIPDADILKMAYKNAKKYADKLDWVDYDGFRFICRRGEEFRYRDGDWDVAARKIL